MLGVVVEPAAWKACRFRSLRRRHHALGRSRWPAKGAEGLAEYGAAPLDDREYVEQFVARRGAHNLIESLRYRLGTARQAWGPFRRDRRAAHYALVTIGSCPVDSVVGARFSERYGPEERHASRRWERDAFLSSAGGRNPERSPAPGDASALALRRRRRDAVVRVDRVSALNGLNLADLAGTHVGRKQRREQQQESHGLPLLGPTAQCNARDNHKGVRLRLLEVDNRDPAPIFAGVWRTPTSAM